MHHPLQQAIESLQAKDVCPRLHVDVTHEDAVCPDFVRDKWQQRLIIDLDPEYRYAAVGHPSRDYLWILARTPTLDPMLYRALSARLEAQGYDLTRLKLTPQPPAR